MDAGAGEAALAGRHGLPLGRLAARALGAGEAGAGAAALDLADEAPVQPVGNDHHRPAGELLPAALIAFGAHGAQPPRSTGAPTRLPHSVHEPS